MIPPSYRLAAQMGLVNQKIFSTRDAELSRERYFQNCLWTLNWITLKGSQAPIQKFERRNRKIPNLNFFLTLVKNWCPSAHLKAQ